MKRAFVANNHLAWFSKKYKNITVNKLAELDPEYLKWCIKNLKHLKFTQTIKDKIKPKNP